MKKIKNILKILLILIFLIVVGLYLSRNALIKHYGEKIASQKYGAKINIDKVNLDVFNGELNIGRVQVTDKNSTMRNIVDLKKIYVKIEYKPLFKKLIIVDKIKLGLVEIFTPRKSDGALIFSKNKKLKPDNSTKFSNLKFNTDINSKDYKKLVDKLNIKILKEYQVQNKKITDIYSKWQTKNNNYKNKLKIIRSQYNTLEKRIKKEKNPVKLLSDINELTKLVSNVNKIVKNINSDKKEFNRDMKTINSIQKKVFQQLSNKSAFQNIVGIDDKGIKQQINTILNDKLGYYIDKNTDFYDMIFKSSNGNKNIVNKSKTKNNNKKSSVKNSDFDFWVKNFIFTFKYSNIILNGAVSNITSKIGISPEPIKINMDSHNSEIKGVLNGVLNRKTQTGKIFGNIYGLKVTDKMVNKNLKVLVGSNINLIYNMKFMDEILNLNGKVTLENLNLNALNIKMNPKFKNPLMAQLKKIQGIQISYVYNGKNKKLTFNTNISDIVSEIIKNILSDNIEKYQKQATILINKEIDKNRGKLNLEINKVKGLGLIINQNQKAFNLLNTDAKSNKNNFSNKETINSLKNSINNIFR